MKFVVSAELFCSALAATAPHTTSGKDDGQSRTIDIQIREEAELIATASVGGTSGVARVPLDDFSGELGQFAIDRSDAATIRGLFLDPYKQVEVTVTASMHQPPGEDKPQVVHQVQIRELGALFGGRQLKITVPDYSKRDIAGIWHSIASSLRRPAAKLDRTTLSPKDMALFRPASVAYGEDLTIEPADGFGSLLVHCGHHFIGFLHADAREDPRFSSSRDQWRTTLPTKMQMAGTGS